MQIIFLLVELCLPEIAQKLAGHDSGELRSKLLRSGMWLLVLALLIFGWSLFSHLVVQRLPASQFNPFELSIFTAWLLVVTGLGLLVLSRYEYPKKTCGDKDQSAGVANTQNFPLTTNKQDSPILHDGVVKTKTIRLKDCLDGVVPDEEWDFFVADQYCRVINNSVAGSKLYVNHLLVAQNRTKMHFGLHKQPALQAVITDLSGKRHDVTVFFRAWLHIKIRVVVNGQNLNECFV